MEIVVNPIVILIALRMLTGMLIITMTVLIAAMVAVHVKAGRHTTGNAVAEGFSEESQMLGIFGGFFLMALLIIVLADVGMFYDTLGKLFVLGSWLISAVIIACMALVLRDYFYFERRTKQQQLAEQGDKQVADHD